jgi:hypothetical protein
MPQQQKYHNNEQNRIKTKHAATTNKAKSTTGMDRFLYLSPLHFRYSICDRRMPPKVLTLPSDVCEPVPTDTGLMAQDIRALFRNPDWQSLKSQNQQVTLLFDFAWCNYSLGLNNQFLVWVLNISPQRVTKIHCKARKS